MWWSQFKGELVVRGISVPSGKMKKINDALIGKKRSQKIAPMAVNPQTVATTISQ